MRADSVSRPLLIYKLACLFAGVVCTVLGYLLFRNGILGPNGSLEASKDTYKLVLTAGPGVFFAFFGASVIAVTIYKGFALENSRAVPEADPPTGHEYQVVKDWFDKACLCVKEAYKRGKFTDADLEKFNMYTAMLAVSINDLIKAQPSGKATGKATEKVQGYASAPGN